MLTAGPSRATTSLPLWKPKNCSTTPDSHTSATASSSFRSGKFAVDSVSTRYTSWPRLLLTTSPNEYAPIAIPLAS